MKRTWWALGAIAGLAVAVYARMRCRHHWVLDTERDPTTGLHRLGVKCLYCGRRSAGLTWVAREQETTEERSTGS